MSGRISGLHTPLTTAALAVLMLLPCAASAQPEYRPIDGFANNLANPSWGTTGSELLRLTTVDYGDGSSTPSGASRPSPREISNAVAAQFESIPNPVGVTDMFWQWGQFLDHDIDLTSPALVEEPFDIPVPAGDPYFDPMSTGTQAISFDRSISVLSGAPPVRQQINEITAYIDASNVYGSDPDRAVEVRRPYIYGQLKFSKKRLLPFNVNGVRNAPNELPMWFLAGDIRANEQVGLTSMHTVFMREHNRIAKRRRLVEDLFVQMGGTINGEMTPGERYETARAIVVAEMQAITYNEFLPILLGSNALSPYAGYNPNVNPGIANVFSTAAYRFGHTMVSDKLARRDRRGREIRQGDLQLLEAFFAPHQLLKGRAIAPLIRGLATQLAQDVDTQVVDGVRNFLFGPPGSNGFDLASLNIQRGRDHGLPSYNQVRQDYGLAPAQTFADITSDFERQQALASVYSSVNDVDVWVGGLAEDDQFPNGLVGELFFTILLDQFERLRDGDRFWYQTYLPPSVIEYVESRTLREILIDNSRCRRELPENLFLIQ